MWSDAYITCEPSTPLFRLDLGSPGLRVTFACPDPSHLKRPVRYAAWPTRANACKQTVSRRFGFSLIGTSVRPSELGFDFRHPSIRPSRKRPHSRHAAFLDQDLIVQVVMPQKFVAEIVVSTAGLRIDESTVIEISQSAVMSEGVVGAVMAHD